MGVMKKARILWNYKWQWQTVVNWSRYFIYAVIRWINIWKAAVAVSHVWKNGPVLPPSAHRCIPPPNSVPEHHFPKCSVKSANSKEAEKHSPDPLFRFVGFFVRVIQNQSTTESSPQSLSLSIRAAAGRMGVLSRIVLLWPPSSNIMEVK